MSQPDLDAPPGQHNTAAVRFPTARRVAHSEPHVRHQAEPTVGRPIGRRADRSASGSGGAGTGKDGNDGDNDKKGTSGGDVNKGRGGRRQAPPPAE